jgi:Rab-like protein 2
MRNLQKQVNVCEADSFASPRRKDTHRAERQPKLPYPSDMSGEDEDFDAGASSDNAAEAKAQEGKDDAAVKAELESTTEDADVKIILLGDSAVGKSKLVERFLMDNYHPRQLSTYALTLFRHEAQVPAGEGKDADSKKKKIKVDFWDTAGQERFQSMHPSYYFRANCCILVFDVTRKATYGNLKKWLGELREYCESIPVICVANKIDVNYKVTQKSFKFPKKHKMPFYFVSAADGTNVVPMFKHAIGSAWDYKQNPKDFFSEAFELLDDLNLGADGAMGSGK